MTERHTLIPVFSDGYRGHLLLTCRGWRACDEQDREIGRFPTQGEAVEALLAASEAQIAAE